MKLYKKYFLATSITLDIQFLMGMSFANAICDNEIRIHCSEGMKLGRINKDGYCFEKKDENIRFWTNIFLEER